MAPLTPITDHPIFTERECEYIRRTPLSTATLAADFCVPVTTIRDIRNAQPETRFTR